MGDETKEKPGASVASIELLAKHRDLIRAGLLLKSKCRAAGTEPGSDSEYLWFMIADKLIKTHGATMLDAERAATDFLKRNPEYNDGSQCWFDRERNHESALANAEISAEKGVK